MLSLALLHSPVLAATIASSFETDAGEWEGGVVGAGNLSIAHGTASLTVPGMTRFTLTARVRVASGSVFSLTTGAETFQATYGTGGGLTFAEEVLPMAAGELTWTPGAIASLSSQQTWEAGGLADPEMVRIDGEWRVYYTGIGVDGTPSIGVATSADGKSWTRRGSALLVGSAPDITVGDLDVTMTYACDGEICRASSDDGLTFSEEGPVLSPGSAFDASGLGSPSVVRDESGGWHLWYSVPETGATGHATSADGLTWARDAEVSGDDTRLYESDVLSDAFGFDAIYTLGDALGMTPGAIDATLGSGTDDIRPLLGTGSTAWAATRIGSAGLLLDGMSWQMAYAGDGAIGLADGIPTAGQWRQVVMDWDGTTLSASWEGGRPMTTTFTGGETFTLLADGVVEVSEVAVAYAVAGDTGADTGGIVDSGGESDSATDSGDSATDAQDSGSSDAPGFRNASQRAHEIGGYCATANPRATWLLTLGALVMSGIRRRRPNRTGPLKFPRA